MKFLRMMLAAALCAAALTGCGGSGTGGSAYTTGDVDKIAQAGAFSEELESVDGDTAFALYGLADAGLDRAQLTDCAGPTPRRIPAFFQTPGPGRFWSGHRRWGPDRRW